MKSRRPMVAIAFLALAACTGNGGEAEPPPEAAPSFTPDEEPAGPTQLLYLDGRALHGFDLDSGASELINELPSADTALSPDGTLIAVVRENSPQGPGPEGFRDPMLMIAGTEAAEIPSELGPGRAPAWSANGTSIAAIAPTEGGETIVVYGVPGGPRETRAPSDELWSMIGWQGDDIVAIGSTSGVVAIPSDGGPVHALSLDPSEIWGVSPVDDALVSVGTDGGSIVRNGDSLGVNVDGALGDGTWSWDGAAIAAVVIGDGASTDLVVVDGATGDTTELDDGRGAQGNVAWAEDGQTFAFVRVDPQQRTRLEALVCMIEATCEPAFSWAQGVTLLGFR